jgi:hypothetical protein
LSLTGAVSGGTGGMQALAGATLLLSSGGVLAEKVSGAGTLDLSGAFTLGTAPTVATLNILAGGALSGAGTLSSTLAVAGTLGAAGGTLTLGGAVSGGGTLAAGAGATLNVAKGGTFAGVIAGAGQVKLSSAITLNSGASLAASVVTESANITLGAGASLTNENSFGITASSGLDTIISGVGADSFTNAGSFAASGAGLTDLSVNFVNLSTATISAASMKFKGAVTNSGTLAVQSGNTAISTSVAGTGSMQIGAAGTLSLLLGAGSGQVVDFMAGTGVLDLTAPLDFAGTISGFGGSDQIDLVGTVETSYNYANNVLTVLNGSTTVANLNFTGASNSFSLASDMHGGTLITFG